MSLGIQVGKFANLLLDTRGRGRKCSAELISSPQSSISETPLKFKMLQGLFGLALRLYCVTRNIIYRNFVMSLEFFKKSLRSSCCSFVFNQTSGKRNFKRQPWDLFVCLRQNHERQADYEDTVAKPTYVKSPKGKIPLVALVWSK